MRTAMFLVLLIGGCGGDSNPSGNQAAMSTPITPASCIDRCVKKGVSCGETASSSQQPCMAICGTNPTEEQITCAEKSACNDSSWPQRCGFGSGGGGTTGGGGGTTGGGGGLVYGCTLTQPVCKSYQDCPVGQSCNTKTGHCFDNNGNCVGTSCNSYQDCPNGETCNSASGTCN
jgi:hypothetical protein